MKTPNKTPTIVSPLARRPYDEVRVEYLDRYGIRHAVTRISPRVQSVRGGRRLYVRDLTAIGRALTEAEAAGLAAAYLEGDLNVPTD